jgi:hypothetical protein
MSRALHPQRLTRALASSRNPLSASIKQLADSVRADRHKAEAGNPFLAVEKLAFQLAEQAIDFWRDQRDMLFELMFHTVWGSPWMRAFGRSHEARRTLKTLSELQALPEVTAALFNIERGGFVEAVIRMLILLAENRGSVRRDRLERASQVLAQDEPFRSYGADRRAMIIHEQTLIATFAAEKGITTLPSFLRTLEERALAVNIVQFIVGPIREMSPTTLSLLQRFHHVLGLPPMTDDVLEDPLSPGRPAGSATAAVDDAEGPRQLQANSGTSRANRRPRGAESTESAA